MTYIALLRAINVGGTGKLKMADLVALCEAIGCRHVQTYIQSGNVVLEWSASQSKLQHALDAALADKLRKPVGVILRTADEFTKVLARNPFPEAPSAKVLVLFLDEAPDAALYSDIPTASGEQIRVSGSEVFVHYPLGQGVSKLKLPGAQTGTMRNLNTLAKLSEMAHGAAQ
jgi:uncharacterized protein (DUF1697 family)